MNNIVVTLEEKDLGRSCSQELEIHDATLQLTPLCARPPKKSKFLSATIMLFVGMAAIMITGCATNAPVNQLRLSDEALDTIMGADTKAPGATSPSRSETTPNETLYIEVPFRAEDIAKTKPVHGAGYDLIPMTDEKWQKIKGSVRLYDVFADRSVLSKVEGPILVAYVGKVYMTAILKNGMRIWDPGEEEGSEGHHNPYVFWVAVKISTTKIAGPGKP